MLAYTLFELFFTFAGAGSSGGGPDLPRYKFTCPAVERQVPRLLWPRTVKRFALPCSRRKWSDG